jgi:chromosome segregation ATPase
MAEHYKNEQHQSAIIAFIHHYFLKSQSDQHDRGSHMDVEAFPHTTTSISNNTNTQLVEVSETIDILAGGVQTLNEDSQRLHNESLYLNIKMDALNKEFAAIKLSIQEQNTFLDGLKPNQEILQQDVASLKQKIDDLQFISYDGILTWKITNFKEKMSQFSFNKICS